MPAASANATEAAGSRSRTADARTASGRRLPLRGRHAARQSTQPTGPGASTAARSRPRAVAAGARPCRPRACSPAAHAREVGEHVVEQHLPGARAARPERIPRAVEPRARAGVSISAIMSRSRPNAIGTSSERARRPRRLATPGSAESPARSARCAETAVTWAPFVAREQAVVGLVERRAHVHGDQQRPAANAITSPVSAAWSGRGARSARMTRTAAAQHGVLQRDDPRPAGRARARPLSMHGLAGDPAVAHRHHAVGRARDAQVVGHEHDRLALARGARAGPP